MPNRTRSRKYALALIVILTLLVLSPSNVNAAEDFDYPELLVTPRATERLEMEAKAEPGRAWRTHLSIQASAVTTLTAGLLQLGNYDPRLDPHGKSPIVGISVGAGWLGVTTLLSAMYRPYSSAQSEISAMPSGTKREQLIRERLAESALNSPAKLARRLNWLSLLSNAATNIYMLNKAQNATSSAVASSIGIIAAAAPFAFSYHWQDVAKEQREYKKRIYAPIASGGLLVEPGSGHAAPGLLLSLQF
jgi:hypothetical protein